MVDHHHRLPPNRNSNDSSMVVIHDDDNKEEDYSVFPPSNHENLYVFSNHHTPQSSPSSSSSSSSSSLSSFSTSDCDTWDLSSPFDSQVRKGCHFTEWLSMGLQILRSKLFAAVSSFRSHRGAFWSFGALITSCWIVMVMMVRKKNKNRRLTPNETRLMNIIKEKDGRIAQLLHQIAQMNQILIDRHKALAAKVVE